MRIARRSVLVTLVLVIGLLAASGPAWADDIAWKATHDTDPHLALTAEQLAMTAQKRAAEPTPVAPALASFAIPFAQCGDGCGGTGDYPPSASIVANQTPQATSYYCGPAAVHEALDALGVSLSQSAAAAALHTTTAGTAWSGGGTSPSGYPVPDVLNRYQNRVYYVPQPVSSPTSSAINAYENDLKMDIVALRAPLVGDAWETQYSSYHLVGHPTDRTIFHWFEIRGYQNSGASTMYEDSVHGASSIGWSPSVPAYSTISSGGIVSIVAGRGYVW
jgi:hypothetical protein